jgi:hypothetical protein
VDAFALVTQWNTSVGNSTTSLTTDFSSVDLNGSLKLTATVSANGSGALSGSVSFVCVESHTTLGSVDLTVTDAIGTASLTVPAKLLPAGNDTIQAIYSGNANFNGSSASAVVVITVPSTGAVVVATFSPNPVYQGGTAAGAMGSYCGRSRELPPHSPTSPSKVRRGWIFQRARDSGERTISTIIRSTG